MDNYNGIFSFFEFGSIDLISSQKNIWGFKVGNKAYDWYMLSRYANDMFAYIEMKKELGIKNIDNVISISSSEIHHKNDCLLNFEKICALYSIKQFYGKKDLSFFELGQTLFGCIEGMEFFFDFIESLDMIQERLDLSKDVKWYGTDISKLFNTLATHIHDKYKVLCSEDNSMSQNFYDVFFAKGVVLLYAFRSSKDLFNTIKNSKLSIFDYSLSVNDDLDLSIGTGKQIRYISLNSFLQEYSKYQTKMYIKKKTFKLIEDKNIIFFEGVYGDKEICDHFISLLENIRNLSFQKYSKCFELSKLIGDKEQNGEWVEIYDHLKNYNLV